MNKVTKDPREADFARSLGWAVVEISPGEWRIGSAFAEELQEKMTDRGITERSLAQFSRVSEGKIRKFWRGLLEPTPEEKKKLMKILSGDENV